MTKSCGPAELDESQAKHQSRPVDERAAAAAAGRFIDVPPDLSTPPASPSPYQGRAPPLLGYSIREFCGAVGISISYFYELKQAGLAPRTMKLGSRRIISVEEAQKWCRERTEASESAKREARQP
jgi:predicted DNA-binding transcriptional regulator AlpA